MRLENLMDAFQNPSAEFRSYPFYSLNGKLDPAEVDRQVRDMHQHGMGGFFLHSREGLETEYMSEAWLNAIQAAVSAAKETGMYAWLYDEDRFPSGGAGGLVQSADRDGNSAKAITMELGTAFCFEDNCYPFVVRLEGETLVSFRPVTREEPLSEGEQVALFRTERSLPCEWFNNEAPPDNLSPDAVSRFLSVTHERYKERFGEEFGKTIHGIFTDEPNIADFRCRYSSGRYWVPWTDSFWEFFAERRGYRLEEHLPEIFWEGEQTPAIRHDYWRTITERFCTAYSKQISEWCDQNNLMLTGHYMGEPVPAFSTRMSGSVMPHYYYQKLPGIDVLMERIAEVLTAKQCSSVANQMGRRSICELYGCTGWEFTFEGQKWVGDWLYALGIDTRCQHHTLYSSCGCRKRDYPPTFNEISCWWEHNHITEDYFARLSAALSGGKAVRQVLVIHPQSTAWMTTGKGNCADFVWDTDDRQALLLQQKLEQTVCALLGSHIDFDFGDELIMEEIASASEGTISIGQMQYPIVLLPHMSTITHSTLELLLSFANQGGTLLSIGQELNRVDGRLDEDISQLIHHPNMIRVDTLPQLVSQLRRIIPSAVSIQNIAAQEQGSIYYLLKEFEDHYTLFLANTAREEGTTAKITLPLTGRVEKWDPLTGKKEEIAVEKGETTLSFLNFFDPAGSALYIITKGHPPTLSDTPTFLPMEYADYSEKLILPAKTAVRRTHPNVLLLDYCSYRLNDEAWSEQMQVWDAQRKLRERLEMRQIHCNGTPQRYQWADIPHKNDGHSLSLRFIFDVCQTPQTVSRIAIEKPEPFRIILNGTPVENTPDGWYFDRELKAIPLPSLKKGENELILTCAYKNAYELEDIFLLGDFGVTVDRKIIAEPKEIRIGDWGPQGYFHYAGGLCYRYTFQWDPSKNATLFLEDWKGVTVHIRVNGKDAGDFPWRRSEGLDITDFLFCGTNSLEIEVVGSQRNVFGLFHGTVSHNVWTDWTFFSREGARNDPEYITLPYGLFRRPFIRIG